MYHLQYLLEICFYLLLNFLKHLHCLEKRKPCLINLVVFYGRNLHNRDDFTFRIVNFPFMCSSIPAVPAFGIYISQLVRMGRICDYYEDFVRKNKEVTTRLYILP